MRTLSEKDLANELEDGFKLVLLQPAVGEGGANAPAAPVGLQIFVVVREQPDPAAGHFVLLRDTPQARVLLGALADSERRVQEWLELWVQNTNYLEGSNPAFGEHLTNAGWDARWRDLTASVRRTEPGSTMATPYEHGHLPPAVLDLGAGRFVPMTTPDGGWPLSLCVDDRLLEDAGLPAYATSAFRYLYAAGHDPAQTPFVRLKPDAPATGRTVDLGEAQPAVAPGAPTLGFGGGSLLVRRFSPLSLEDFSDVVGGRAWKGLDNARKFFRVPGVYRLLEDEDLMRCGPSHLFTTAQGRTGRLGEILFLKMQVLSQVFRLVRETVRQSQLPCLNISAESFRVRLGAVGFGLPFLWTAQADLVRPGASFALPLRNTTMRYFQGIQTLTASVYRPGFVGIARQGAANVRIRKVFPLTEEGIAVEGTIRSTERLSNDENDLISVSLPLSEGTIELLGRIDFTQARSEGEAVFRSIPQALPTLLAAALRSVEGSAFSQLAFSILSPLSTPFDMYSLGVVALRVLLAHDDNPLPDVLDRAFSLAHEAAQTGGEGGLEDRIAQAFATDPRWREALGFQHTLYSAEPGAAEVTDSDLPGRLWWSTLAFVLKLFPKLLPESFCKGYGDAPPLALETIFDEPMRELDGLLLRWRAFLLGDWRQNQEIAGIIGTISNEY